MNNLKSKFEEELKVIEESKLIITEELIRQSFSEIGDSVLIETLGTDSEEETTDIETFHFVRELESEYTDRGLELFK